VGYLIELDKKIFLLINGLGHSGWDYLLAWPTLFGTFLLYPFVLIFMFIWGGRNILKKFVLVLFAGLVGGLFFPSILKEIISRPRPFNAFYDEIAQGTVVVNTFFQVYTSNSFPSGHSALVFSVAASLNYLYGNKLWILYLFAGLVGLTRIYVGAHFPSDVIAGALVGIIGAKIALRFAGSKAELLH